MATATMQETRVKVEANTPQQIKSMLLSDGKWHTVRNCERIQYAIDEAHSPIAPSKLYPYLKFLDTESGKEVRVPFSQVVAFETE